MNDYDLFQASRSRKFKMNIPGQKINVGLKPMSGKLFNWNFHPLEVVSCLRDLQLQVSEKLFRFDKIRGVNDC